MECKTMETVTIDKLQKMMEETPISNIDYRHDFYDYFTFTKGDYMIQITYHSHDSTIPRLRVYKKEIKASETKSLFTKRTTPHQEEIDTLILDWGNQGESKVYPEFWSRITALVIATKKRMLDKQLSHAFESNVEPEKPIIKEKPVVIKKNGYNSRVSKALSMISEESK